LDDRIMKKLLSRACLSLALLSAWSSLSAAPVRQREKPPEQNALPPIALDKIADNAGAVYGDWAIWRYDDGKAFMIVNQKTNMVVYLTWVSNGWINYRTRAGTWHVLFPTGTPNLQDRRDLDAGRFLGKQPTHSLAEGKHTFQNWTVTIAPDAIEFFCPNIMSRMMVRPNATEFTHNNRVIADSKTP
jgi:hypothetical protein